MYSNRIEDLYINTLLLQMDRECDRCCNVTPSPPSEVFLFIIIGAVENKRFIKCV